MKLTALFEKCLNAEYIHTPESGDYATERVGNTLYIYGLNDKTGAVRYDSLPTKPQGGDTIIIAGPIQKYGTTIEIYHGRLQSIE